MPQVVIENPVINSPFAEPQRHFRYWIQTGGADPVKIVKQYADRVLLLHVKDGPCVKGQPHTADGQGKVKTKAVLKAADKTPASGTSSNWTTARRTWSRPSGTATRSWSGTNWRRAGSSRGADRRRGIRSKARGRPAGGACP